MVTVHVSVDMYYTVTVQSVSACVYTCGFAGHTMPQSPPQSACQRHSRHWPSVDLPFLGACERRMPRSDRICQVMLEASGCVVAVPLRLGQRLRRRFAIRHGLPRMFVQKGTCGALATEAPELRVLAASALTEILAPAANGVALEGAELSTLHLGAAEEVVDAGEPKSSIECSIKCSIECSIEHRRRRCDVCDAVARHCR